MVSRLSRLRLVPLLLFITSFAYYALLSSKQFTWIFGSGDSGGWLASALTWQPPQPFGNPLYVLLGHALASLPGDIVIKYTIIGSCLASSVTVSLVYFIVRELTGSVKTGLLSTGVLLTSVVFLSQSTTLSQYPLAVLCTVLAFWFYLKGRKKLAVLSLGLGTAMHFIVGGIALFWFLLEWRQGRLREWVKLIPLFLVVGILPYMLILWELRMYYGELNLHVLSSFISNTSGAGGLVVQLFPERLLRYVAWIAVSLGVALVPIYYGVRSKTTKGYWLITAPIIAVSWYYLTAQDPTVWHYLPWAMPFLAILAGVGLSSLADWKPVPLVVTLWVLVMLITNTVFFNANVEAQRHPAAMTLYNDIASLPENARVIADRLGPGATVRYVIAAERTDIKRISSDEAITEAYNGSDVYTVDIDTLAVTRWSGQ